MTSVVNDSSKLIEDIFGWFGSALAMFFYIAPVVPLIKMVKREILYTEYPGVLWICSFGNCILWFAFGWTNDKLQVYVANGAGGAITAVWIMFYLVYFAKQNILASIASNFIFLNFAVEIYYICVNVIKDMDVVSYIAMAFNILMYAAPGEKLVQVFKTKNYKLIPIFSCIAGLVCSTCWCIYGIYINTISMIVPNGIGIACAILQIVVWIIYYQQREIVEQTPYSDVDEVQKDEKGDNNQNTKSIENKSNNKEILYTGQDKEDKANIV